MEDVNVKTPKEIERKSRSFFHIDKEMLRFKAHYFLFEGGTASVTPFIPVVAKNRLGLSATSLAVVVAAHQFVTILSKPVIGYIADYFNRLKLMINILLIIQTIFFFLILSIPPLKKPTSVQQFRNWNEVSEMISIRVHLPTNNSSSSNISDKNKNEWNIENKIYTDVMCVPYVNTTELLCFQTTDEKITQLEFGSKSNFSCSAINPKNFTDSGEIYNKTFNLLIVLGPYSSYPVNDTCSCTMTFTKNGHSSFLPTKSDISDFETSEFWIFAVVNTVTGICVNSLFSLSDTACCESVQRLGGEFGRQRLFGAVGWGILAALSGVICDLTGGFLASWIFMAVLQIIAVWNISQLDLAKPHFSQSLLKDIGHVLKSVEFTAFELGVFFNGIGAGVVWFYLIWFLSGLGASKFLCGLTQYIQCFLGEIPFMFFADWFIRKLGHFNLISLSLLSYASRFLWYSYLKNPWLVLPAEIAHGFTYGTLFPTIASYGKLSAKPGTEATTQSILFMTHGGLGAGLGCILTGICFDKIGPHQTFFYFFLMTFSAAILNFMMTFYFNRRNVKKLNIYSVSNIKQSE
ncbi:major facilitator superfamily domain-containing protein 6 [Parasteatoda tepidariorum]|uniref:major facilitator superfamily domain-containing protein 6 n=1 Tax=Parasteatoda tepidariorum TaxID=114398 RepID=UPI001C71E13B|nr:major facilitator superfamily domain-containing protein 6 [Parasteatoda tepidariorum]